MIEHELDFKEWNLSSKFGIFLLNCVIYCLAEKKCVVLLIQILKHGSLTSLKEKNNLFIYAFFFSLPLLASFQIKFCVMDVFIVECAKQGKMEGGGNRTMAGGRRSNNRERKMALLQDVI